ncbi:glutamine synthetase III [Oceanispirochaeta sp.]|jgi:glutamine synthetase|uniref:glutamine synthetase III family protein n=1 Tax=Oceanispirochaeta sp. TaxID=2035350 RepID=UPI00260F49E9|nr:glutamine synthetase III [Oceanispirochaeta sp.]MDA3958763.1 glutamine synthetase III [Oceanispirochaeta sp.]
MNVDYSKTPLTSIYGENCFSEAVMKERLPKSVFKEFKKVQVGETVLSLEVAEVIASAMKDWAIERGATHYTHWFHPLTGLTAEKHDSFISPEPDGTVMMEFSGKELIQGEPDASSFPNGGLRATFEARGYTAWDTGSPAFLKADNTGLTLTIPTAFVSYNGEALDKKTPLLRSMDVISRQAMRILKAMGNTSSKRVTSSVGPEQEYFLIDKEYFLARPDLMLTGRTVFGSMSAKGQEMDDHYFGAIKNRVADFMRDLNTELWKLGIPAKTQHNEVAPNQFELAPIYSSANVATDANQLTMEMMKKIADRHDLACLLHEKPFAGINGNGKHNNWSIATDDGINLLNPGKTPHDNAQFLLFTVATIKAVDVYSPILRASAASPGNDHRLGANEAPPAVISIFLGDQLSNILESMAAGKPVEALDGKMMEIGATTLPDLPMDMTDRNRTSPFAFTGNKFEFRMVGSTQSIAGPNVVLNTAVASILDDFAGRLEKASDVNAEIQKIICETYRAHDRIIFNGNGYSPEWLVEAERRGLPNLTSTVAALPEFIKKDSVTLFEKYNVLSKAELESRVDIYLENYSKQINIEAGVALEMANRLIFPVVSEFSASVAETIMSIKSVIPTADTAAQESLLDNLNGQMECMLKTGINLGKEIEAALELDEDLLIQAKAYREQVVSAMNDLRICVDALERSTDKQAWPYPSYEDMLFNI